MSAQLENTLENLSSLANIQVLQGSGGSVTVLLGGQTTLVQGTQMNAIQAGKQYRFQQRKSRRRA